MANTVKIRKSVSKKSSPVHSRRNGLGSFTYFYCFLLYLLRGQDNDLSLVNGVGVHKTVGVALENGLVLHHIAIGRLGNSAQRIASLNSIEGFAAGCDRSIDAGNLTLPSFSGRISVAPVLAL